jgi:hypothetical protein
MSTDLATISEKVLQLETQLKNQKSTKIDDSLFSKELAPHYMQMATKLANSQLVPKGLQGKPADIFLCMALGYQVGLSVEQSIQDIAVINGRPCVWGDAMLALCMSHPDFVDIIEQPLLNNDNAIIGYKCTVKRKGQTDKSQEFRLDDAKRAGLLGKPGPWTQYPSRMLQMRARSYAIRDKFADALKGLRSREEVMDYIDGEIIEPPQTRTQNLKQDIMSKQGLIYENDNEQTTDSDIGIQNEPTSERVEINKNDDVDDRSGRTNSSDKAKPEPIKETLTQEQNDRICQLMEEKAFPQASLDKALEYYEVDWIPDLSIEQADHFIAQLEKR